MAEPRGEDVQAGISGRESCDGCGSHESPQIQPRNLTYNGRPHDQWTFGVDVVSGRNETPSGS